MLNFFDKIAFCFYSISKDIFHSFSSGENKEIAKIQTIFIISSFQGINVFFIVIDPILVKYYCLLLPKIVLFAGVILLLVFNYYRYIWKDKLEKMTYPEGAFFGKKYLSLLVMIVYFALSGYLFMYMGDYVKEVYGLCMDVL